MYCSVCKEKVESSGAHAGVHGKHFKCMVIHELSHHTFLMWVAWSFKEERRARIDHQLDARIRIDMLHRAILALPEDMTAGYREEYITYKDSQTHIKDDR